MTPTNWVYRKDNDEFIMEVNRRTLPWHDACFQRCLLNLLKAPLPSGSLWTITPCALRS